MWQLQRNLRLPETSRNKGIITVNNMQDALEKGGKINNF